MKKENALPVNKNQLKELMEGIMVEMNEAGYDLKYDSLTREVVLPEHPSIKMTIHISSIFNEYTFPEGEEELH